MKYGACSLVALKPPKLVSKPSITPVCRAGGTSPKAIVVGFAPKAPSNAFSAGPILLTFLPAKSPGTKSLLLTAPAPIYILK